MFNADGSLIRTDTFHKLARTDELADNYDMLAVLLQVYTGAIAKAAAVFLRRQFFHAFSPLNALKTHTRNRYASCLETKPYHNWLIEPDQPASHKMEGDDTFDGSLSAFQNSIRRIDNPDPVIYGQIRVEPIVL
jgi:hypothetical protein